MEELKREALSDILEKRERNEERRGKNIAFIFLVFLFAVFLFEILRSTLCGLLVASL